MAFKPIELSLWGGKPVALVEFVRGGLVWRYTSGDRPVTLGAATFLPAAISRSEIEDGSERLKSSLTITMPADLPVAGNWRPYPPGERVLVRWMTYHHGDTEVAVEWMGRAVNAAYSDTELELTCEPSQTSSRSRGLTLRWQRGCPLALYSQGIGKCNVDKSAWAIPSTVLALVGATLTSAAFLTVDSGRLRGGYIEWVNDVGETERRSIMEHSANAVVLDYGSPTLPPGAVFTAYPGCSHNWEGCESFNNTDNYGGAYYMPVKTPFDGFPVW